MKLDWLAFKNTCTSKNLLMQMVETTQDYKLFAVDNQIRYLCSFLKSSPASTEQLDFEANYKATCNQKIGNEITKQPELSPFSAKALPNGKKLFKRLHGIKHNVMVVSNTITFTIPYPSVKMTGLEFINASNGDTASMTVLDSTAGNYSGVPNLVLNQFAFDLNVCKDFYSYNSEYDADLYQGMQVKIVFMSMEPKQLSINLILNEVK